MDLKLAKVSVVVLSEGNNPRLLNPDFLERNGIVPVDWPVKDVLVTPPLAQITYENGVQFLVEIGKVQIQVNKPEAVAWEKKLPDMATTYLDLLPHVTYRAAGVNFIFNASRYPDRPYIRLLKEGRWLTSAGGLTGAIVELQYRNELPNMNVRVGVQDSADSNPGSPEPLVFTVNFHHDFNPDDSSGRAAFIGSIGILKTRFLEFVKTLPFD
jgi:hypothetical protein